MDNFIFSSMDTTVQVLMMHFGGSRSPPHNFKYVVTRCTIPCHYRPPRQNKMADALWGRFCTAQAQRPIVNEPSRDPPEHHPPPGEAYVHKANTADFDSDLDFLVGNVASTASGAHKGGGWVHPVAPQYSTLTAVDVRVAEPGPGVRTFGHTAAGLCAFISGLHPGTGPP